MLPRLEHHADRKRRVHGVLVVVSSVVPTAGRMAAFIFGATDVIPVRIVQMTSCVFVSFAGKFRRDRGTAAPQIHGSKDAVERPIVNILLDSELYRGFYAT